MILARLQPRLRKGLLSVHLVFSLGWVGAAVAYLVLGLAATSSDNPNRWVAAWTGMELIGWGALTPLAVGTTATGVVQALLTPWGLWQHYWVVVSLVTTVIATAVLVQHMGDVTTIAADLREGTYSGAPGGDLAHTFGGLIVLMLLAGLNVYKPRGLTRHVWRAHQRHREARTPA